MAVTAAAAALGAGGAVSGTAKAIGDTYKGVRVKELDNIITKKKLQNYIDLKKIDAQIELTNIRQRRFTERHKTTNETIQTFRNTAEELVNSHDKPFLFLEKPLKKGGKLKLEGSILGLDYLNNVYLAPILSALSQEAGINTTEGKMFHNIGFQAQQYHNHLKNLVTKDPSAFHKSVTAGTIYTPPEDPDRNTDNEEQGKITFETEDVDEERKEKKTPQQEMIETIQKEQSKFLSNPNPWVSFWEILKELRGGQ